MQWKVFDTCVWLFPYQRMETSECMENFQAQTKNFYMCMGRLKVWKKSYISQGIFTIIFYSAPFPETHHFWCLNPFLNPKVLYITGTNFVFRSWILLRDLPQVIELELVHWNRYIVSDSTLEGHLARDFHKYIWNSLDSKYHARRLLADWPQPANSIDFKPRSQDSGRARSGLEALNHYERKLN